MMRINTFDELYHLPKYSKVLILDRATKKISATEIFSQAFTSPVKRRIRVSYNIGTQTYSHIYQSQWEKVSLSIQVFRYSNIYMYL